MELATIEELQDHPGSNKLVKQKIMPILINGMLGKVRHRPFEGDIVGSSPAISISNSVSLQLKLP